MVKVYYNEFDPNAAAWLRELAREGLIPDGEIDTRSICDVQPADVMGFDQCHFFAGIGGWPLALQLAGWGDRPVWTGSAPCQPFSEIGKHRGHDDDRDLWPEFRRLIRSRKPPVLFGEQVASTAAARWCDGVASDLEEMDYAFGATVLCSAAVLAIHLRKRLYWCAHAKSIGWNVPQDQVLGGDRATDEEAGPQEPKSARGSSGIEIRSRRVREPGLDPVAYGIPTRVANLNRYVGNAIDPQLAAEFIKAYMEATCPAATH